MFRKTLAAAIAPAAVLGGLALSAAAAHAAPAPQYATGVANGTGATAAYANGTWTLDSGHGTGGGAQVDLVSPGTATVAPAFTADHEGAGNPRWVIEFHNGAYLFGYPAAGDNASALSWTLEPGGTAETDYAHALAAAQAGGADDQVTAAFIVEDTGNPDTTVNLTNVTYNGSAVVPQPAPTPPPAPVPSVWGGHVVSVNNTRAVVGFNESVKGWPDAASKCVEVWISGPGFGAWDPADPANPGTAHVGFTCDHSGNNANLGYLAGLTPGHLYALRILPATGSYGAGNNHPVPGARTGYVDVWTTDSAA